MGIMQPPLETTLLLSEPNSASVCPVKLTFKQQDLQLAHTWTIARGPGTNISKTVLVELTGADGTVGLGEAAPIARYKESLDTVQEFFKKIDARGLTFSDVEGSMSYLDTVSPHDMSA
jgi:hypothetical protein